MAEFWEALRSQPFMRNALLAGILASLACGIVGTYVVARRIVLISGGIAHAVLGGLGVASYYGFHPLHGALVAALVGAVIIGLASLRSGEREDTIIGAIWATGMAIGILFISQTPGYNVDLMSYLFGNILMVPPRDLYLMAILDIGIVALISMFYKQFLAVCFDEEYARLQGVRVEFFYLLLLCLVALTVVLLIQVVGIVLVIALLTLPAAIAGQYVRSLSGMMIVAVILSGVLSTTGLMVSYLSDLPAGATIIVLCAAVYLISTGLRRLFVLFQSL